jgi:signal transduction histidine kinase
VSPPSSHPVTLRFRAEPLEAAFQAENQGRMVRYVRWPLLLGGLLFTTYGFIDQAVAPARAGTMWAVRFAVGLVVLAVAAWTFRPVGRVRIEALFSAVALASGAGLLVETWFWADAGRLSSHTGLVILLIYIHVLSRMPFVLVAALGWTISLAYLVVLALHPASTPLDLAEQGAAVASANLTGMVASYVLERYARRVFWQTRSLEERQAALTQQAEALREANGELARALDELTRTQARLVQSEKLASLGALTAGIAHEIKNPLNFVNNFAGLNAELVGDLRAVLAPRPGALDDEVRPLLDDLETNANRIEEHGRRADAIVRAMLAHARGGAGERQRVDLNALVEEYARLAHHEARARDGALAVRPRTALDPAAGAVEAAPDALGRLVANLVGNALDAVEERAARGEPGYEPAVVVSTHRRGGGVELRVEDNGVGIPEPVRDRVFEPFFTTKPAGRGAGLGLSLAHDIAVAHGGTLAVESEGGRGATFVVTLPVLAGAREGEGATAETLEAAP